MRFWDTSALVPLCVSEPASRAIRRLATADPSLVVALLGVHPLRAADAFQLAAALIWSRGETSSHAVVSYDERLRAAASGEGFAVLPD